MERAFFPDAPAEDWLLRMLRDGRHVFLLWEEEGSLLGYAWYEFVLDEGSVGDVAVAPEARRRGIGRALTEAMLADAGERGLATLTLEVRQSNASARALYESCGFREVGRRKNYYEKPREDALLLTASL
jgi:ribosomal-protein-alanine N-acetyltransferase